MDIRVVLLPDLEGNKVLNSYSEQICNTYPSFFQLGKGCFSHVTLLHSQIDGNSLSKVNDTIKNIAENTKKISIDFDYNKREKETNNYISVFLKDDEDILNLRTNLSESLKGYIISASKFKLPHITFAKLINSAEVKNALLQLSTFTKTKIGFTELAVCEVGENGTCKKVVYSYKLGK